MNVPKLRFKEFDGEWEEKKIGGFFDHLSTGSTPSRTNPDYFKGEIPWISSGELKSHYISDTKEHVSELAVKETNLKIHPPGTFFIAITGLEAKGTRSSAAINTVPMTTNQSCLAFKPNDLIDLNFLYFWYKKNGERIGITYTQGTKQQSLTPGLVRDLDITVPKIEEQKYISRFFNIVEKKIELQQQKIDLLQEQKKGYMQKVFKQELRFKNEEGQYYPDWKNRKIRDLFEVTRGHVLSTKEISEMGKYPVYSSQTKNNGLLGYYDEFLFENAITWTTDGANAGNVKYRSGKFYCTNVCGVLLNKEGYANKCIAEIINSIAFRYVSYVGNPKLMNNVMGDISIDFPCIEEQKKISDFLLILDNKINLEETTLKLLRNQKKGFMQKMFI